MLVVIAVPAFAVLIVMATADTLAKARDPLSAIGTIGFFVLVLGGLVVVPGAAMLARLARGVPDVRIDDRGVVWGLDRSRDLSIDWADIDAVVTRRFETRHMTDRLLVLRPKPGRADGSARTAYGRIMGQLARIMYGSPYAISTVAADHSWEEVRAELGARLPAELFERPA